MEVQEIKIDGVTYVPFGETDCGCEGCALLKEYCVVGPYDIAVCDIFNRRRLRVKDDNTED